MESTSISKLRYFMKKLTSNVNHTIEFLRSEDKIVLEKALISLLDYSEESQRNVSILFKKDVIKIFISLLPNSEIGSVAIMLKIIMKILKNVPGCLEHILETNAPILDEIKKLFLTTNDRILQELSTDLLSYVSTNAQAANQLVTTNVISTVLARLETEDGFILTFNLLRYLDSLAKHAKYTFINVYDLRLEVLFHYTTIPVGIIQHTAFDILDTLTSWKSYTVGMLLCRAEVIEHMLNYIMDNDYELFNDRAFKVIYDCCDNDETASYFIDGTEFINFCRWSKTCNNKYIFFSAAFITLITRSSVTREKLICNSIDNTVLSYLRCNDPPVFYKNCQMLSNLMQSASCPLSVTNDDVIHYIIEMLQCNDDKLLAYHEMALKTLWFFLVCRSEGVPIFLRHHGINTIYEVFQNWKQFTDDGLLSVMRLIYVLGTSCSCNFVLDSNLYRIVITCFSKSSVELSKQAVLLLCIYLKDINFTKYFLKFNGPKVLLTKLQHIDNYDLYRKIVSFVHSLISVDGLGKYMLFKTNIFPLLNSFDSFIVVLKFPEIRHVLHSLCEHHRELKFYKYGFLAPETVCDNRFYIINDARGFCLIENMLENCASPIYNMYVVNFVGPPLIDKIVEQDVEEVPLNITPVACVRTGCTSCSFSSNLATRIFCNLCNGQTRRAPSVILPVKSPRPIKSEFSYGIDLKNLNYGSLSPDPFLLKHLEKLTCEVANLKLRAKVKKLAQYVVDTICEPINIHTFFDYIMQLKHILGTSMIPIGYLRFGYECERALLFKALADKLDLPVSLHKNRTRNITRDFMYWNEFNEKYIIDLMVNVGDLIEVGHPKSFEYCSMIYKR